MPFVARCRKEATGGLDDTQLRTMSDRLAYLRELEARRTAILRSVGEQGKLTDEIARAMAAAETKAETEDLYLPFRPKRRTKAMIARERGLEPLLRAIEADRAARPNALAERYFGDEVLNAKTVLEGARDVLAEELRENADLLGRLRAFMRAEARLATRREEGAPLVIDLEAWIAASAPGSRGTRLSQRPSSTC